MSTERKIISVDIAIFGGGIAGLWLLNRLRQQGVSAILLETNTFKKRWYFTQFVRKIAGFFGERVANLIN